MNPLIGSIMIFAGNFAPRNFAFCNGQLLAIAQNTALFSILGTTYGGDGRTTYALPDLRGRVALSPGTGPGLSTYNLGQRTGIENVTLNLLQMPSHTHTASVTQGTVAIPVNETEGDEDEKNPGAGVLANTGADNYSSSANGTYKGEALQVLLNSTVTNQLQGGSQSHTNIQPYLAINYIIAMFGVYPSRS